MRHSFSMLALVLVLASCGNEDSNSVPDPARSAPGDTTGSDASHHGSIVALGCVDLGGESYAIARHGACTPGKEGAFVVSRLGAGEVSGLFLWVEDSAGEQITAPAQGDRSGNDWHFHVTPRGDAGAPDRVVLRLREGGRDERAGLALHAEAAPVHDGVSAPLLGSDGKIAGWLELKLHDDKGDLEAWFSMDLPLDAVIKANFPGKSNRTVDIRVRNTEKNEDEDGKANVREGRTNYFIFPGSTGADASWLQGGDFRSAVTVTVPVAGKTLTAGPFVLVPHGHGPGGHQH